MGLNIPHLQKLLNWLEAGAPGHRLDMGQHYCGTTCCISGYTAVDLAGAQGPYIDHDAIAEDYLGLLPVSDNMQPLFYPVSNSGHSWSDITPAQAAQAVRNVMAGNDPDWSGVLA